MTARRHAIFARPKMWRLLSLFGDEERPCGPARLPPRTHHLRWRCEVYRCRPQRWPISLTQRARDRTGFRPLALDHYATGLQVGANTSRKTATDDVRNAMAKLEKTVTENPGLKASGHLRDTKADSERPARIDKLNERLGLGMEPTSGLEPLTCRLRIGCSTN